MTSLIHRFFNTFITVLYLYVFRTISCSVIVVTNGKVWYCDLVCTMNGLTCLKIAAICYIWLYCIFLF